MLQSRIALLLWIAASSTSWAASASGPVKFNRDIRPIMSDTCSAATALIKRARMADMRLDRAEASNPTPCGMVPIVPGDPDKSAIVARIFAADPARRMPPEYADKTLPTRRRKPSAAGSPKAPCTKAIGPISP